MKALSKSDEQKLLDGVKLAVDLVDNQGLTPNAALQKVAEDFHYSPGFLKSACNAFNTGRQLAQWETGENVLDKLASFPLADYGAIHDAMWGSSQEKVASYQSTNLSLQPRVWTYDDEIREELVRSNLNEKQASASIPSTVVVEQETRVVKKAADATEYATRAKEEARRQKTAAEDNLNLRLHLLESYFKKFAYDRLSLAQVQHGAAAYYGTAGKALMDYVAGQFPSEKRASDYKPSWKGFSEPVNRQAEPYTLIDAAIKAASDLNAKTSKYTEACKKYDSTLQVWNSFQAKVASNGETAPDFFHQPPQALTSALLSESAEEKKAFLNAARMLADQGSQGAEASLERQINQLDDPHHINEMRKIRAQTVLTQLMSDPDNPLSGYDPEEVLAAYNDMVQLSPRLADQPAAVGPLLNKRLAGNVEPFEVGETLKLEKSLKDTQSLPSYSPSLQKQGLMQHENSILG
jgi:hypothetical protein